nr:MAG TPA: hypothetical protein [Caudoviricetes sp.]
MGGHVRRGAKRSKHQRHALNTRGYSLIKLSKDCKAFFDN